VAEAATARYAAGRGAQQDVLRALTERVRVEEQRVMAAELGRLAEARLNSLMQRGLDEAIGALDEPPADLDVEPAAVLEARALDGHADLRQVDRDTAAADAGIEAALAERGRDYLVAGGFMVMPDETNAWTARVGVSWPSAPWARGRLDAMTREAEARRAATLAERRSAERRVRLAVHEARTRAESAQRRLLEAQREWVAARLDLAAATADRQRAAADLVEALGVPEHDPATGAIR
jgi:outer membrane protein TolC